MCVHNLVVQLLATEWDKRSVNNLILTTAKRYGKIVKVSTVSVPTQFILVINERKLW